MSCDCNCSNDCCPEVVPVTVNEYTIDNQPTVTITVEDTSPVDATKQDISIQVEPADTYELECRFEDNATPTAQPTVNPPDTLPGVAEFEAVTDATGLYEFTVEQVGAQRTWYLNVMVGGVVNTSVAITAGT